MRRKSGTIRRVSSQHCLTKLRAYASIDFEHHSRRRAADDMRLATWNVNSVGARLPRLLPWLEPVAPDVVALQETKCADSAFPCATVQGLGFEVAHAGDGRLNGVALLSKVGLTEVSMVLDGHPEPRLVSAQSVRATL